jgi:hypothetical protein
MRARQIFAVVFGQLVSFPENNVNESSLLVNIQKPAPCCAVCCCLALPQEQQFKWTLCHPMWQCSNNTSFHTPHSDVAVRTQTRFTPAVPDVAQLLADSSICLARSHNWRAGCLRLTCYLGQLRFEAWCTHTLTLLQPFYEPLSLHSNAQRGRRGVGYLCHQRNLSLKGSPWSCNMYNIMAAKWHSTPPVMSEHDISCLIMQDIMA